MSMVRSGIGKSSIKGIRISNQLYTVLTKLQMSNDLETHSEGMPPLKAKIPVELNVELPPSMSTLQAKLGWCIVFPTNTTPLTASKAGPVSFGRASQVAEAP